MSRISPTPLVRPTRRGLALTALGLLAANTGPAAPEGQPIAPSIVAQLIPRLERGQWMALRPAENQCPKLYMLDSRTCPYCMAFMRQQYLPMERAGYDIRIHYAAVASEGAGTIAEIGVRRDIRTLLTHQLGNQRATGPDPADAGGARLDAFNSLVETTQAIRLASRSAGYPAYLPSFVWQDRAGAWRISSGYNETVPARLRVSLPAPPASCRR